MNRIPRDELMMLAGRRRSNGVTRWLESQGWNGLSDADGWPIVTREWLATRMGGTVAAVGDCEPDYDALKAA